MVMSKNRETVSGPGRAGGSVSVVSIRGSAEAGIVGGWGDPSSAMSFSFALHLLPRRRSAMAPLLGLGSGDSAVRGSAAPFRGERETHHPHRSNAASPLDAIKKGDATRGSGRATPPPTNGCSHPLPGSAAAQPPPPAAVEQRAPQCGASLSIPAPPRNSGQRVVHGCSATI